MEKVFINIDGQERQLYFGIEELADIERKEGKALSEILGNGTAKLAVGVTVTFLWAGLKRFSLEFKGDQGWYKAAETFELWLKKGDQTNKWFEVSVKLDKALMASGTMEPPKPDEEIKNVSAGS